MRARVPIRIAADYGMNASYQGPRNAHVKLGAALVSILTREELKAVVAHELGHRNLYHIERCWATISLGYMLGLLALVDGVPWWWCAAPLAGLFLAQAFRIWHEFEADYYAMRAFGAKLYRTAFLKILRGPPHWTSRARLRVMDWYEAEGG